MFWSVKLYKEKKDQQTESERNKNVNPPLFNKGCLACLLSICCDNI